MLLIAVPSFGCLRMCLSLCFSEDFSILPQFFQQDLHRIFAPRNRTEGLGNVSKSSVMANTKLIPMDHIYLVRYSGPYGLKSSTNQVPWTIVQNNKNEKSFRIRSQSKIYRMYANKYMWCVYSITFPIPFLILVSFQAERTQSLARDSHSSGNGFQFSTQLKYL